MAKIKATTKCPVFPGYRLLAPLLFPAYCLLDPGYFTFPYFFNDGGMNSPRIRSP
jgi:hypothetical protein